MHPDRIMRMQEPAEDEVVSPQPLLEVTGSNTQPLGQRNRVETHTTRDSPGKQSAGRLPSDNIAPVQPGSAAMPPYLAHNGDAFANAPLAVEQNSATETPEPLFRSLAQSNDPQLFTHLSKRNITVGFLREIDQFLHNNPELYFHSHAWAQHFNAIDPLAAYKFFIRGYTKPARYVPGFLPDPQSFTLPQFFIPAKLLEAYDEELTDFFEGNPFRYDILQEIDRLIDSFCYQIQCGVFVKSMDRKLVVYALWGNPIDAYKYYEYNYQTTWLKHRYLPEHIELDKIPKAVNYTLPVPSVIGPDEGHRSHPTTRARMARAQDEGVDVLDVLMQEFIVELARKGLRRNHIATMRRQAQEVLDQERDDPQGYDLVDLVMGMADAQACLHRPFQQYCNISYSAAQVPFPGQAPFSEQGFSHEQPTFLGQDVSYGHHPLPGDTFTHGQERDPDFSTPALPKGGAADVHAPSDPTVNNHFKTEPSPSRGLSKQGGNTGNLKGRKRKIGYSSARTRLITAQKEEQLLIKNGISQVLIQAAQKARINAERSFANAVLSLNKTSKQLTTQELTDLSEFAAGPGKKSKKSKKQWLNSAKYRKLADGLLTRYGNLLS